MLTKKMLNQYLEEYNHRAGLFSALKPLPWITHLRHFASQLQDDSPLDITKQTELKAIMDTRPDDQPLCDDLFTKIYNALHYLTHDTAVSITINDVNLLMKILIYLRPEHIAPLMVLNKEFNTALRHQDIWKATLSNHFPSTFLAHKNNPTTHWLQLFKITYAKEYRGMSKRTKALFSSAKSGDLDSLIMLNLKIDDLYLEDSDNTPLYYYASKSSNPMLHVVLYQRLILPFYTENGEINYLKKDRINLTYLYWGTALGQFDPRILKYSQPSDTMNITSISREAFLYIAAGHGHLNIVNALIHAETNVNARCKGVTPLYMATQGGHLNVVNALIKASANIDIAKPNGTTPLFIAAQQGHLDIVNILIHAGANSDIANHDGATPFFFAVQKGHLDIVNALIQAGANVNIVRNDGAAPLHIAALNGRLDIVNALIQAEADINITMNGGKTPLDNAKEKKHTDIVKRLSRVKLDQAINNIANAPVGRSAITLFGRSIEYGYSKEEALAAAVALKIAVDSGDQTLLKEHRRVLKNTNELAPLYRNLI